MTYFSYLIAAILVFYVVKKFFPIKGVNQITTSELKPKLKNRNIQFIDVRTDREYRGNHIKGFRNIPLDVLSQQTVSGLSKEKEVIVLCQSGIRSQQAAKKLKQLGFTSVTNVKGGMNSWRER